MSTSRAIPRTCPTGRSRLTQPLSQKQPREMHPELESVQRCNGGQSAGIVDPTSPTFKIRGANRYPLTARSKTLRPVAPSAARTALATSRGPQPAPAGPSRPQPAPASPSQPQPAPTGPSRPALSRAALKQPLRGGGDGRNRGRTWTPANRYSPTFTATY
ncbi:unnamed protein product [Lampetra planeri]